MDTQSKGKKALTPLFVKGPAELSGSEEAQQWKADEFPHRKSMLEVGRRDLLKMMGGGLALAGLSGCRWQPQRKIVPFVDQPEGAVAGQRKMYASMTTIQGYAVGLLVDQIDGRPVRLDGHPEHPASMGRLNSRLQAEILGLYDPDRLTMPTIKGDPSAWKDALAEIRKALADSKDGSGVAILSETVGSPTLARLGKEFLAQYPQAKWYQYEAVNQDNVREGTTLAFNVPLTVNYNFADADVVVSIDSDALYEGPGAIRYAYDFAQRRKPGADGSGMNRTYCFESHPRTFGVAGDHRFRVKASDMLAVVKAIAARLGVAGAGSPSMPASVESKVLDAVVDDLSRANGRSLLVPGAHLGPEVHAACHAVNAHLGNIGSTVKLLPPVLPIPVNQSMDLANLSGSMANDGVKALIILGGNPVYATPGAVAFGDLLERVPLSVYLGTHKDETALKTTWQLPVSHFLEAWGDGVAFDGTYTIQQPLIEPLYDTKSAIELFSMLLGGEGDGQEEVRFEKSPSVWTDALSVGVMGGSMAEAQGVEVVPGVIDALENRGASGQGLELVIEADPMVYDGRYANNNWLQETPKPITNLVWDNALLMSYATAKKVGVTPNWEKKVGGVVPYYGSADMVKLTVGEVSMEVPVWVNLGQTDDVVVLHLGGGRTAGGQFAKVRKMGPALSEMMVGGFDANKLRKLGQSDVISGVTVEKIAGEYPLANTQHHNTIDASIVDSGRELIQETTVSMLAAGKPFGDHGGGHGGEHEGEDHGGKEKHDGPAAVHDYNYGEFGSKKDEDGFGFYTGEDFKDNAETNYQWAMTIDLSLCTGCNACVTACQAENNIPTVEKDQVMRGRELHWMRIDRYYKGTGTSIDNDNPPIYVQPVTCMHCEQAPCEPVCPVAATVHSHEGINQMVYNRCVGTRYCSNNCPYKVRRFNFFHYSQRADQIPVLKMLQNPDVTVRFRGVMEKCTYCNQRLKAARVEAKREGREIRDGEAKVACQVACPSDAILFGDMRREVNAVARSRESQRNYLMLEELNTKPRTSYLSRVTNPHPDLEVHHG